MTSNIIKFVHENRITEIKNPDPNETLLNYVRTKLKKNWHQRRLCRRRLRGLHSCFRRINK